MADIEKLVGSESRLELGQKINDIIENKANTDLSNLSATGESKFNVIVPTGTIISSAGSSTPTGYLYCNGSAVSRTTYAKLFSAIGTTYGAGDGSTTFNLPNYSTYKFVTSETVSVKGNGNGLGLVGADRGGKTIIHMMGAEDQDPGNCEQVILTSSTSPVAVGSSSSRYTTSNDNSVNIIGVTTDATKSGITGTVTTATIKWYIKY